MSISVYLPFRSSLGRRIAFIVAIPLIGLTAIAAYFITQSQVSDMREQVLLRAKAAARLGAEFYGRTLEQAIDSGILSMQDVFDRDYQQIQGYEWGEAPKYHTKYDFYTDYAVLSIQDAFLKDKDFVFALGEDVNGYIPTHNSIYQKPWIGNIETDIKGNRTKRIFDDPVGLTAARYLGKEPLVQTYVRDTGVTMLDVSSPIFVKGKHWGGFRLAVSLQRIEERSRALFIELGSAFGAFAFVAVIMVFGLVSRSMRPVTRLAHAADSLSMGEDLTTSVDTGGHDEIAQLSRSLDRLRISMNAAMSRLED